MRKKPGPPSKSAKKHPRAQGELEKAENSASPTMETLQKLHHELEVHQTELEMQNEELRQARNEAEESRNKFRELYEFAPVGYLTLDAQGLILGANLTGATILEVERSRLLGRPFTFFLNDSPSRFNKFLAGVFSGDDRQACEVTLKTARKGKLYVRLEAQNDRSGQKCLVAIINITDLRQEELFHLQLECVEGYAIFLLDTDGNVLNWNLGAERLKGYRAEEIVGQNFSCLYSEQDRAAGKPEQDLKKAAAEGHFSEECWQIRKDGSGFWADVVLTPLRDAQGHLWGFSKVTRDITDRKRVESAFRESEARFHAMFNLAAVGIAQVSLEGHWLLINQRLSDILGYSSADLEELTLLQITHPDDVDPHLAHIRSLLAGEVSSYAMEKRLISKDGSVIWVNLNVTLVRDPRGQPEYFIAVVEDVNQRKLAEEELRESEEKFFKVFSLAPIGMTISTLSDGKFVEINEAGERLSGYPRDEVIGRTSAQFNIWRDASERSLVIAEVLQNGKVRDREMKMKDKAGSDFWGLFSAIIIEIKGKKHLLSLVSDIDERKRAQEALRESEERFRLLADTAPVLIWMSGSDSLCTFFNKPWLEFTGRSFEQEQGAGWMEGVHPEDLEDCREVYQSAFRTHQVFQREYRLRHAAGGYRWIADTGVPRIMPDGEFVGFIGSSFDVTERKLAEQEIKRLNSSLRQRASELEDVNQELEAFNYTVAHDLRQPLNIISSCCQVIERLYGEKLERDCKEHLELAYRTTLRMDRLIEALLNFSRMGHVEPRRETVDLGMLAREVAGSLLVSEPERKVDFHIADGIVANVDTSLLRVVFHNLLGNALKYTSMREKAVIEFGAREVDGVQAFFVRDNGEGFASSDADSLFTPFRRLPGAEKQRGFGIGLATVERIIQRHGGKVWAEGEREKGACFYFTIAAN